MSPPSLTLRIAVVGFVAVAYFLSGKVALQVASINASASPAWPPTGVALAAFLLLGNRIWPVIMAAAFVVNFTTQGTALTSIGIATGNTLEGLVGAFLVNRFAGGRNALLAPWTAVKFALLGGVVATAVSATIGVLSLAGTGFAEWHALGPVWLTWWLGDVGGALIVAPAILAWARWYTTTIRSRRFRNRPRIALEMVALLVATVLLAAFLFQAKLPDHWGSAAFTVFVLPVVTWATFRFEQVGATTVSLALSVVAISATLAGQGPFMGRSANESLLLLQTFMVTLAATSLVVAALVTDRRQSHEALRQAYKELDARVRQRTQELQTAVDDLRSFTSAVSHDLRTPLAVIRGQTRLLQEQPEHSLSGEAREIAADVHEESKRLIHTLESLLRLSRINKGPFDVGSVDLSALASSIAAALQATEPTRRVTFDIEPNLVAEGDPALLRLLLENLLGNSWKFTGRQASSHILFGSRVEDGALVFVVEDDGVGFRHEDLQKLFVPFSRLRPDGEYPGNGIGLATAKRIVERHGGRIWATPRQPAGAMFFFTLPGAGGRRR